MPLRFLPVLIILLLSATARAQTNPVSIRAAVDTQPLQRGSSARIVVEVKIAPPFHIQSAKPLDKDLIATMLKVGAPAGVSVGAARVPVEEQIQAPAGTSAMPVLSVYSGTVYFLVPIKIAADAPLGSQSIEVALRAQACDDKQCLPPKNFKATLQASIVEAGAATTAVDADLFAAADKQKYVEAPATKPATATTVAVPAATSTAAPSAVPIYSQEEQLGLIKERNYKPFNDEEYPLHLIILFALAGGAILNVMPCVLPVIPLKVLSLVQQAHGDRRLALFHGLAFSAGVITLFVALALILKTLGLFYGQQFQSPAFSIALVLFVVALAMSMLGVWTINPPKALYAVDEKIRTAGRGEENTLDYAGPSVGTPHGSFAGSFSNGLMATLLATPCSAPYLGPVFAWAFPKPAWLTALTLAIVGVGLSLPYLLLAIFPGALKKVPRAGRWSELLKQFLGIVMIGVAIWFIPSVSYWIWVILAGVLVALVCWAWGQIPTWDMPAAKIWTIRFTALVLGAAIGSLIYVMGARTASAAAPALPADARWQPFNVALLDDALAHGRPVVIDWTASWCINCRALEATVLNTDEVDGAFKKSNTLLLRADLTNDNPPASLLNRQLGGESIPVLAIFSPSRPYRPTVLRDSYTTTRVLTELAKAQ